jgi:hypothetical protein
MAADLSAWRDFVPVPDFVSHWKGLHVETNRVSVNHS